MGITIHYEGRLRSEHELELVLTLIRNTARSEGWPYEDVCESVGVLERVVDDEERDYAGQVRGVVAHPHEDSEPLRFLFGDDLFLQDYCKTQFSSPDLHVAIVTLFRALLPHFDELRVEDEGEFWDTDDVERLRELWDDFDAALALALEANPCAKVKVRLPSGRIIDMLE